MAQGYWLAGHVTVTFLLTLFVEKGASIQCYVCNSFADGRQCDTDKYLTHCDKVQSATDPTYDACEIHTVFKTDGTKSVSKNCAVGPCAFEDKSQTKALDIHKMNCLAHDDGKIRETCKTCCSKDKCNMGSGSPAVQGFIHTLYPMVAAILFFKMIFV